MIEMFRNGGFIMWPMTAVAVGIVWISARTAARMQKAATQSSEVGRGLQSILFWGGMSVLLGIVGTVVGLIVATQAIAHAGAVHAPTLWGGVGVTLISLAFGILIFLFAAVSWFMLRQWSMRMAER
jgi:biopolymer transport protein ExbB/TolQ